MNSFVLKSAYSIGVPVMVNIWHDDSGSDPDWFLSKLVIVDIKTQKWLVLACDDIHHWLFMSNPNINVK